MIDLFEYVAFLPIYVLLVTLVVDKLLKSKEKHSMLKKLNMVIGAFFGEAGIALLRHFAQYDQEIDRLRNTLIINSNWSNRHFLNVKRHIAGFEYSIDSKKGDLESLHGLLADKRDFLLNLLANPNLLEHETFTDLLWAVTHLAEELGYRDDLRKLPKTDYDHLSGDIKRAYSLLVMEWLSYMKHLKNEYPYLFSLALRTNPFDPEASVEIK
jgi:hypothetical protein